MSKPDAEKPSRVVISGAYEGDAPPALLGVGIVNMVDACKAAMPDAQKLARYFLDAGCHEESPDETAETGRFLALEHKLIAAPLYDLRHRVFQGSRKGAPLVMAVSEARTDKGKAVFCSTVFFDATEADCVKAVEHVVKRRPAVGGISADVNGRVLRRVFWEIPGEAGLRAIVISGPADMDALDQPRAIIGFHY